MARVPSVEPRDERADEVSYSFRASLMGSPHAFRLAPDALHWQIGRHEGRLPYQAIRRVRLAFRPANMQTHRFIAEIWSDDTPKLSISSVSRRGLFEQERQDAAYKAFVRALHRRIAAAGATPTLQAGSSPWLYWPGLVLLAVLALTLPALVVRSLMAGAGAGAAIVGVVLVVLLAQLGLFFWRNRPGSYAADAVPTILLPRG